MNELITKYQNLMNGLNDLSSMMCSDDPGSTYVKRLAEESTQFYIDLLNNVPAEKPDLKIASNE